MDRLDWGIPVIFQGSIVEEEVELNIMLELAGLVGVWRHAIEKVCSLGR